jgi:hypothetical protein
MNPLSQWLQLMLAEIARKQEEAQNARAEEQRRSAEQQPATRGSVQGRNARR